LIGGSSSPPPPAPSSPPSPSLVSGWDEDAASSGSFPVAAPSSAAAAAAATAPPDRDGRARPNARDDDDDDDDDVADDATTPREDPPLASTRGDERCCSRNPRADAPPDLAARSAQVAARSERFLDALAHAASVPAPAATPWMLSNARMVRAAVRSAPDDGAVDGALIRPNALCVSVLGFLKPKTSSLKATSRFEFPFPDVL
jgi:hypothetical protein